MCMGGNTNICIQTCMRLRTYMKYGGASQGMSSTIEAQIGVTATGLITEMDVSQLDMNCSALSNGKVLNVDTHKNLVQAIP